VSSSSGTEISATNFDSPPEARVIFEAPVQPVVLRFEADPHSGRIPMPGDHHFVFRGEVHGLREVILAPGQGEFSWRILARL